MSADAPPETPATLRLAPSDNVLVLVRSVAEVGEEIVAAILKTAAGEPTASESLGHPEFVFGYKQFEPVGPACHPLHA